MSDLSWSEWCSLPSGNPRNRALESDRARELNKQAKSDYYKFLIENDLVCEDFKKISLTCNMCAEPKDCINDPTSWKYQVDDEKSLERVSPKVAQEKTT